jgi:uncharacterized membrane protein
MGDQPQYGQPPMQAPSAGAKWGPTSIGMEAHITAGLGYFLTPILPLIFFFMEKTNKFVRFHAMQSIILGVAEVIVFVVLIIVDVVITGAAFAVDNSGILGLATSCLLPCVIGIVSLGFLGLWLWGMISGFTGKAQKLPVIGDLAEKWSGGAPTPTM